ncbi:MAG TPA: CocE/NonD family hydrolase [Trebonia sp.]|jgi:predicted acyl esterase|nr:CocE/NonD family hydrolase [Trebonia sp.]
MADDSLAGTIFQLTSENRATLDAIREAMLDPSPRRIGRLDQWGLADEYEVFSEVGVYREAKIPVSDGTLIDAALSMPQGIAAGQACPVIVMPAPLIAVGWQAYQATFAKWALGGYACLAYSQRGLSGSTGEIQVAGPLDWSDGTEVIDWVTQLDGVDADRIGCFGASYGAGTSMLIAAHDQRVKAVVGCSAWTDLFRSLFENDTRHMAAFEALVTLFIEDRCSPEFRGVIEKVRANAEPDDEVKEFAVTRSPRTYLGTYNDNALPMLLGTYWHETIFSSAAVVEFFNDLTSPKSLLIQVGDHGNGEMVGFQGLAAKPTDMGYRWMDHFLGGAAGNGEAPRFDIRSETMFNAGSDLRHATWADYARPGVEFCLTGADDGGDGRLVEGTPETGWTTSRTAGESTQAIVAPALVLTGVQERLGLPHSYATAQVDRAKAWVWNSAALTQARRIQGELNLRITVTPSASAATIVAYLFEYNPNVLIRRANIITSAPYTILDATPGEPVTIEFGLAPADYPVQRGRQLQLVIDCADPFFAGATDGADGVTLEASSPEGAYSYISIPLVPQS